MEDWDQKSRPILNYLLTQAHGAHPHFLTKRLNEIKQEDRKSTTVSKGIFNQTSKMHVFFLYSYIIHLKNPLCRNHDLVIQDNPQTVWAISNIFYLICIAMQKKTYMFDVRLDGTTTVNILHYIDHRKQPVYLPFVCFHLCLESHLVSSKSQNQFMGFKKPASRLC